MLIELTIASTGKKLLVPTECSFFEENPDGKSKNKTYVRGFTLSTIYGVSETVEEIKRMIQPPVLPLGNPRLPGSRKDY